MPSLGEASRSGVGLASGQEMIASLPLFHRIAGQPVIVLGVGDAAEAKRRLVERAGGIVIDDLQEGIDKCARLAFVAHESEEAARVDAIRLRCAGILVNATDRPDLCDFTVPSILDRSPVLLAIGTGGASAGLAKALRLRLETLLPEALGRLATGLSEARTKIRERWPGAGDRRVAIDAALGEGGPLDPLDDAAPERIDAWLSSPQDKAPNRVFEVRITSSDPEDLTLRTARLLGSADAVVHEPGVASQILDRSRADAVRIAIATGEKAPELRGSIIVLRA